MPFATSPLYVSPGSTIELRYPTPSTWNTQITFQVQIGEGVDDVVVGTKLPDAAPDVFSFQDQYASTSSTANLPGDFVTTIERNTTYYSQQILVDGVELRIPVRIQSSASGPKSPSFPNLAGSAAYSINGGPFITEANSFVAVSGTTTIGSKNYIVGSTAGLSVGMYVMSANITGEIINISGNTLTIVEPATATGSVNGNAYFTVQNGDLIRLRVTTEDWYTTNSNVTLILSDDYWTVGDEKSDTWSITTRAQDQTISTLFDGYFRDFYDARQTDFGDYKTTSIDMLGIDADVVLEATSTNQMEISVDQSSWSQNITGLTFGDTLYIRTRIGLDYTTKTTGILTVFANPGDTLPGGFENNTLGSYGTGNFQVTQAQGSTTDNQQIWTEVDRYPDPISLSPVFTYADVVEVELLNGGSGFVLNNVYPTTNTTNGSATGLTLRATNVVGGQLTQAEIVERGSGGYTEDDILQVNGATTPAFYRIKQYRKVFVSTQNEVPNAEIDRYYYVDIPISGLGTEYLDGAYDDLESPYSGEGGSPTLPIDTSGADLNGAPVQIRARVSTGDARIRKNDTGTWTTNLFVENGDTLNFRFKSNPSYNVTTSSTLILDGPSDAGPAGNPTLGPVPPTFADLTDTLELTTREPRLVPRDFRSVPVFTADEGTTVSSSIPIEGIDANTTISVVSGSATPFSNPQVSNDGVIWGTSAVLTPGTTVAYVRLTAGNQGSIRRFTYRIGNSTTYAEDIFVVIVKKDDYIYQTVAESTNTPIDVYFPQWSEDLDIYMLGGGGGRGGNDSPNSFGGSGAPGNILAGTLYIDPSIWPGVNRLTHVTIGQGGQNGQDFGKNTVGGAGGPGWRDGGDGGDGSNTEYSGSGGGGGGATALEIMEDDGVTVRKLVMVAGGGGGGGGAGADTVPNRTEQNGNQGLGGGSNVPDPTATPTSIDGVNNNGQGGGGGGAGGGWGEGGDINTQLFDEFGGLIGTTDLDGDGGTGGGWYYDPTEFTQNNLILPTSEYGSGSGTAGFVVFGWPPQDLVADPFSFTTLTGQTPLVAVESDIVQITGITGFVFVNISTNGQTAAIRSASDNVSILSEAYVAGVTIQNGDYIQLQMTPGALYNTNYTTSVTVGETNDVDWIVTTGDAPDFTPNPFNFIDLVNQEINTSVESNQVDIGGINQTVQVTASNGAEVRIGTEGPPGTWTYGPWITSTTGSPDPAAVIQGGQRLQLRITTSPLYNTDITTDVIVGNSSVVSWTVGTENQPDLTPDTITFITATGLGQLVEVFSNYVEIEDISEDITITVDPDAVTGIQAYIELNGVQTGLASLTVTEFDIIRLYFTTSDVSGEVNLFTVTYGTETTTWTAINAGDFGTTPDEFTFGIATTPNPGTPVDSITVTVQGITDVNGVEVYTLFGNALVSVNGGPFQFFTQTTPNKPVVFNGDVLQARLTSPAFPGFSITSDIAVGSGVGSYTVFTTSPNPPALLGQWYSSLNVVFDPNQYEIDPPVTGLPVTKLNTKFDGLPVGSMIPVFKENTTPDSSSFGDLDGSPNSRFPGWIYCDGQYVQASQYPLLYEVLGTKYGASVGDFFRLPDMRNKKVVGTGPVNGQSLSSPSLTPQFGPNKTASLRSSDNPGSHGGLWFIDTIASPSDQVIPQVDEPPAGLTPTESQFFDIGTLRTTGYTSVSAPVEFITTGTVTGNISLKETQLYEVPFHVHELITGIPDSGSSGYVQWGSYGGYPNDAALPSVPTGEGTTPTNQDTQVQINIWGYCTQDLQLDTSDLIETTNSSSAEDFVWQTSTENWSEASGYQGTHITGSTSPVLRFSGFEVNSTPVATGANAIQVDQYIDLATSPFAGSAQGGGVFKFVASMDIPSKTTSVRQFRPDEKLKHTHYITLETIGQPDEGVFSYGNDATFGIVNNGPVSWDTTNIDVEFNTTDLGIEVLPGTFTLGQTKQLIPTPSLSPQEKVGLITPYTWVKWIIKAY